MELDEAVDRFKADPEASGFIIDFDGTLSAIAPRPEEVEALPGATEVLEALAGIYPLVVVLSGRRAQEVARLVPARGVRYAGVYGAEELAGGSLQELPESSSWRGMASRLARDAEAMIRAEGLTGAEVEYKDVALSLHYRNAQSPDTETRLIDWAEAAAPRRGFNSVRGRKVVELRPAAVSKAAAVERIVSETNLERAFLAGDDSADVEAMARLIEILPASITVGVDSSEAPPNLGAVATHLVSAPLEVVRLLRRFV